MDKVTKDSVNYRPAAGGKFCGNCDMYHTDFLAGKCDLVKGMIQPWMLCDKWVTRGKGMGK